MKTTRRKFIQAGAGPTVLAATPAIVQSQTRPSTRRTLRVAMMQDLNSFDPVLSTSLTTSYHSHAIYDTLFGLDANFNPQPRRIKS